jgi:hypothetical protein
MPLIENPEKENYKVIILEHEDFSQDGEECKRPVKAKKNSTNY